MELPVGWGNRKLISIRAKGGRREGEGKTRFRAAERVRGARCLNERVGCACESDVPRPIPWSSSPGVSSFIFTRRCAGIGAALL